MIREDQFVLSHRPYAVDLDSLKIQENHRRDSSSFWYGSIRAVWFRRRRRETVACIGYLWDYQDEKPENARQFLERHKDGRYGGTTLGRWDGEGYWGAESLEAIRLHTEVLRPMLENYPELPEGFDGWWTFKV